VLTWRFYSPHELKKLLKRYGVEVEELKDIERVEFYSGKKKDCGIKSPGNSIQNVWSNLLPSSWKRSKRGNNRRKEA